MAETRKLFHAWMEFHRAHPEVAKALADMALTLRTQGHTHWGIGNLWEVLRYNTALGADVPEEDRYKLNNNHRAYYARYLMRKHPALEGFFEVREIGAR